jgi:ankyrin repeat protein
MQYGYTPLWAACTDGNAAVVELLLKAGADIDKISPYNSLHSLQHVKTPLNAACGNDHVEIIKLLISNGADVNKDVGVSN